jgi:hypothetical protein
MSDRFVFPLYLRAYLTVIRVDIQLASRGFVEVYNWIKNLAPNSANPGLRTSEAICRAVDIACVFYFKEVLCLQRAAVTTILLRENGFPAEMVIGVQQWPFRAHAWVEVGGRIANDRPYLGEIYQVMDRC